VSGGPHEPAEGGAGGRGPFAGLAGLASDVIVVIFRTGPCVQRACMRGGGRGPFVHGALANQAGIFSRDTFWALSPSSVSIPISFSSRTESAEGGLLRRRLPITVFSCRGTAARRPAPTSGDQPEPEKGPVGGVARDSEDGGAAGMGAGAEEKPGSKTPVGTSMWRSGVDETPTCARTAKVSILSASAGARRGGAGGGAREGGGGSDGGGGARGIECSPGVPLRYGLCRRQIVCHVRRAKAHQRTSASVRACKRI